VVDSRARRKRRQEPRSSAYYTNSNFGTYSGVDYALNLLGFGTKQISIKYIKSFDKNDILDALETLFL
jgi:hypothetical protein